MRIDLEDLASSTGLSRRSAEVLAFRAAIALGRRYRPGVVMVASVEDQDLHVELRWEMPGDAEEPHQDFKRVTEEGAEGLALALVCASGGWRVTRRLQSLDAERADWLLSNGDASLLLEVGGTDQEPLATLLRKKLDQARSSPLARRAAPAACVVRFLGPTAKYRRDHDPR